MNIVLIGYRGSGKSTVGHRLANELWKTFVDTDVEIVKRFDGLSIAEIWQRHGEPAFRAMECQVVADVLKNDEQIIALGGGSVMPSAAREALAAAPDTIKIYLRCDPDVLAARLAADAATRAARPSLTGSDTLSEIESVLAEREPTYRAVADRELDVTRMNLDDVCRHIITLFL